VEKYFTYIIESETNHRWYIGHTNNINRRLDEHSSGQNISTRGKGPWKLIFLRDFDSNLKATRFELELKRLKNKKFIKKEYSEFFLNK